MWVRSQNTGLQYGDLVSFFGKDQGSLGRAESNNLTAMLTKLGWVRKEKKERVKPYGPQFVFVPGDVPD